MPRGNLYAYLGSDLIDRHVASLLATLVAPDRVHQASFRATLIATEWSIRSAGTADDTEITIFTT